MGKILGFQSCAYKGEFTQIGVRTPSDYWHIAVETPANIVDYINNFYSTNANLAGKVTGIGYGWQQYTVESSGKTKFSVRGAAGGTTAVVGATIDPVTGKVTGRCNRSGRGAKLEGTAYLHKGDILYLLVGFRGWCNDSSDWGAGGGGASVVLLDNPNGDYTFAPLNRKVDVLFVAGGGGGGYDSSFDPAYYGRDADYNDGTNTNGGAASGGSGGAGLTGNASSGSSRASVYSLLSGNPSTTSSFGQVHYGAWGGGGAPYDGGGGGAGYSGGRTYNNTYGDGGTSYINPDLCDETFRGYATVAEDSERNLENPWTAYGYIEIELGRDENKLILAHDSDGYKWFNGQDNIDGTSNTTYSDTWELLPDQSAPVQATYDTYGKTVITSSTGLKDKVKFLVSSTEPDESILITGNVNGAIIQLVKDFNTSDVSVLKSFEALGNLDGTITNFAVSKDSGLSWQTYKSGRWDDIDITSKATFQTDGCDISQISTIPLTDWKSYMSKKIRIALCITQNQTRGNVSLLTAIKYVADLTASWRHFTEDQASYEYISDTELKVTFLQEGNYKVNYLDELTNGSTSNS